jgi:DNA-binding IclR family transcriptional regulator
MTAMLTKVTQENPGRSCGVLDLTPQHFACLRAIFAHRQAYGRSPSYRQIAAMLGLSPRSKSTAHRLVMDLESRGYLRTPIERKHYDIEVLRIV